MVSRGVATFTLDYGRCPRWLFERMVHLGRELVRAIVAEEGPEAVVERLGDPVWFQSLGTVLAFDWNASGLTTILTAALKEAIRGEERELGIFICGGKGKTSRKTPQEILTWGDRLGLPEPRASQLVYTSRMTAKVDSALVQDGFQLYHHSFFFTRTGAWTVVQQGMNTGAGTARRYHWHSKEAKDLVAEPHAGIMSDVRLPSVLNLTAPASEATRAMSTELVSQRFPSLLKDLVLLSRHVTPVSKMARFSFGPPAGGGKNGQLTLLQLDDTEFKHHPVEAEDFARNKYLQKILWRLCDEQPATYEKLLSTEGVGAKTVRALALVAEMIYGAKPSYEDPARYSFAFGGKDGTPYPVDRATYDRTVSLLRRYVPRSQKGARLVE
jgi:hypothetical protein